MAARLLKKFYDADPPPNDAARFDRAATAWLTSLLIDHPEVREDLKMIIPSLTAEGPLMKELGKRVSQLDPDESTSTTARLVDTARELHGRATAKP